MSVSQFLEQNYRHFNAREVLETAKAYCRFIDDGGKMFLAMAGAMSTAEIGVTLAQMIREDKVHAISCTAANLEEDIFNVTAHDEYRRVPHYRNLSLDDELALRDEGFNRVTDTCIPESCFRHIESHLLRYWQAAAEENASHFMYEYMYRLFDDGVVQANSQISLEHCWVHAAWEKGLPIYTPGVEDCTLGNIFTARVIEGKVASHRAMRSGTEQMEHLVRWYQDVDRHSPIGFFQIGGGIAGDFAICAVPLIVQDLEKDCRLWSYFAQISDSTTSYGSYSGAAPSEKITWHKLDRDAPMFSINSDASIVAPLIFAYILGQ